MKKRQFFLGLGLCAAFSLFLITVLAVSAGNLTTQPSKGAAMPDPPADAYWTLPRAISTENIASPRLARDNNGNLHLLYLVVVNPGPGTGNLYYRKSTDHGATWSAVESVTGAGNSRQPDLAVAPNGTVHIVWIEDAGSDNYDVKYTSGTAGNWAPAETVSPGGGLQGYPAIAVEGNYAHIVWGKPYTAGNPDIFYKHKKLDTGDWEPTDGKLIEGTSVSDFSPDIAVDGNGKLYVIWTEELDTIYYSDSIDHGASWSEHVIISGALTDCRAPSVAVGTDGYIHVTWGQGTGSNQYLYYVNFAPLPSSPTLINPTTTQFTVDSGPLNLQTDIEVVGSDEVHIILNGEKEAGEEEEVYYLVSNSKGAEGSWSSLVNVSRTTLDTSIAPAIAVGNDMVYIVWEEQDGSNYDLYFSARFPYGVYAPLMERNY